MKLILVLLAFALLVGMSMLAGCDPRPAKEIRFNYKGTNYVYYHK